MMQPAPLNAVSAFRSGTVNAAPAFGEAVSCTDPDNSDLKCIATKFDRSDKGPGLGVDAIELNRRWLEMVDVTQIGPCRSSLQDARGARSCPVWGQGCRHH